MRNLVYSNQCLDCKEKGKVSIYLGETSKSAYERGGDHVTDYKSKKEDSHILKHQVTEHNQAAPRYQFRILARFQSALMRQVTEAVLIRRQEEGTVLNSKGVFNRCSLPRLTVEGAMKKDGKEEEGRSGLGLEFDKGDEITGSGILKQKRSRQPNERTQKVRKKLKIDEKTAKEDNPRVEGIAKRRGGPVQEFGNECKRIRPDFSPELEYERINQPVVKLEFGKQEARAKTVKTSIKMFSIFCKPNELRTSKENLPKFIQRCPNLSKTKSENVQKIPKKSNKNKSLTTNTSKPGGADIRKYFNRSENPAVTAVMKMKTVPTVPSDDSCQQTEINYTGAEIKQEMGGEISSKIRARESEVIWDPVL